MAREKFRFASSRDRLQCGVTRIVVAILVLFSADAFAQRSYFRLYDQDYGLDVGEIVALAQDEHGFLWIGSHRGLVRFDGRSFVLWDQDEVDEVVAQIIYGPGDELVIRTAIGRALRRAAHGLEPIPGPDGKPLLAVDGLALDADGNLWIATRSQLWRRSVRNDWSRIDHGIPADERPLRVFADGAGVVALTDLSAWRLHGSDPARRLMAQKDLWFAASSPDGTVWLATHHGTGLWRIDTGGTHALERPGGRAMDMRERGGTLWLSLDKLLLAYATDGSVRKLGIAEGLPSGGPLFVDRENSLWLGTFVGLMQFPEPDTWQWGEAEGLPSAHTYSLAEYQGTVFASTWSGLAYLNPSEHHFIFDASRAIFAGICALEGHGVWAFDRDHLLQWRDGGFAAVGVRAENELLDSCAADASGTIWFATTARLLRLPAGETSPHEIAIVPAGAVDEIWLDADGELRVLDDASICRLRTGGDRANREDCRPIGSLIVPNSIASVAANRTWIAANNGIFEFDGKHMRRLPGNHLLAGGIIQSLTPATAGDWWAAGAGALLRVHDCGGCDIGWEVRETPGQWQGLPGNSAILASENTRGDLWIAGNRGIWRIPKAARAAPERPPPIMPVRASVDTAQKPLDGMIELSPDAHRLELEFAALSFRDRTLLRFRSRLAGHDEWSAPSRSAVLQFAALEPGTYLAEMAASLDGEHWSEPTGQVEFRVLPPWYRTWWSLLLFAAFAIALLAWIYRLRVAALLRVERERTRIAMDLHDELGSGLGSIGMLAGVAAREGIDAGEQRRLMREVANLSGLLGSGLRSLVWSLRSGRAGLAELAAQIADHARRLFPGDVPRLTAQLPTQAPDTALAPELRRHILLLALEALHNVARHAGARNVALTLEATPSGGLHLTVTDDGRGFDSARDSTGAGLESMRRRAAAIGARLEISSAPDNGTRVILDWPGPAASAIA
jgi:signal transduction histidine kinase/ligand-binding sensor domain-containing protein